MRRTTSFDARRRNARLMAFAEIFFNERRSTILERGDAHLIVELSREADEALRYRPFYWTYVDAARLTPSPLIKTYRFPGLASTKTPPFMDMREEVLTFGAPRVRRMLEAAIDFGRLSRAYETDPSDAAATERASSKTAAPPAGPAEEPPASAASAVTYALEPWLYLSYTVAYTSELRWERFVTYGVRLTDLRLERDFDRILDARTWTSSVPPYRPLLPPLFSVKSAVEIAESRLRDELAREDRRWVESRIAQGEREKAKIERYYAALFETLRTERTTPQQRTGGTRRTRRKKTPTIDLRALENEKRRRIAEIEWQYTPSIDVTLTQIALLYLRQEQARFAPRF
ncbi:MAG: hypothetical protein IMW86_04000 [Hydrogenibacillus sp.]|nr:hypothetical protein [Hydrogenibacillus sp.]